MATKEQVMDAWLAWQKQVSISNDKTAAVVARANEIGASRPFDDALKDNIYLSLKADMETETAKCEPLMKAFKEKVKEL